CARNRPAGTFARNHAAGRHCQPASQPGAFWRDRRKIISLHQQKEEERGLFLFLRFWGKLSYMSGKIIL
ncbi:MAG: hypothetical protein PUF44_03220, partial [Bacteroidales bacterium]|nr:hypothetical protein [Bacteroidales bacterium]